MGIQRTLPPFAAALFYSLFAGGLCSAAARASIAAGRLYVPVGYDDNDEVVVVVEGYLDNACEQIRGARVSRKGTSFIVEPQREIVSTKCDDLKVPYTLEVVLNPDDNIPEGHYEVEAAGRSGRRLVEQLDIKVAAEPTSNSLPYAPVDDAEVGLLSGGKMRAVITGRLQNTCVVIGEMKIGTKNGKTYELLPITKKLPTDPKGHPCQVRERRYTAKADFDEPTPGRYLLHVRSQGRPVNRLFSNIW